MNQQRPPGPSSPSRSEPPQRANATITGTSRRVRALATAFGVQVLLIAWLTWPLALHVTDQLPATRAACRTDTLLSGWTLAWETHALTTAPGRLLDANIYHPEPRALFYGPTFTGALPVFGPIYLATGNAALALNVTLLTGVVLTAAALHLIGWWLTGSHAAGFVAGLTFVATRWTLWWWLPTAPPLALLQYTPFIIAVASRPRSDRRHTVLLAALILAQGATDVLYTTAAVVLPLGLLAAIRLARPATRLSGAATFAAIGLGLAGLLPLYAGHADVIARNPAISTQTVWTIPPLPLRLPWDLLRDSAPIAVPIAALVLVAAGALLRGHATTEPVARAWRHATFWAVSGAVFSIPAVVLPGEIVLRLPHAALLGALHLEAPLRASLRLGLAALIGISLLAALALRAVADAIAIASSGRIVRAVLALGIALAVLAEHRLGLAPARTGREPLPSAYPLAPPPVPVPPRIASLVRAAPGPLLELPVPADVVRSARSNAIAMYRSTAHWAPLLNGYDGYYPTDFPARMALAARLPDSDAVAELRRLTGLAWVLVRTRDLGFSPARADWQRAAEAGTGSALRLVAREDDELLFAVRAN